MRAIGHRCLFSSRTTTLAVSEMQNMEGIGVMQFLSRGRAVLGRFVDETSRVVVLPTPVWRDGKLVGYLESISVVAGRMRLAGWSTANEVKISHGTASYEAKTGVHRDGAIRFGERSALSQRHYSFEAEVELAGLPVVVHFLEDGTTTSISLLLEKKDFQLARRRARAQLAGILLKGAPRWLGLILLGKSAVARGELRRALSVGKGRKKTAGQHRPQQQVLLDGLALSLASLATEDLALANGVPIYFAHSMGGGAKLWLNRQLARETPQSGGAVVVRLGGRHRFRIELYREGTVLSAACNDFDIVTQLLKPLRTRRVIYSNAVGDPRPYELPAMIASLRRRDGDTVTALFHDFLPLSPSYMLLNSANEFVGVPRDDDPDPIHIWKDQDGTLISLRQWRAAWRQLLSTCDAIIAFSSDSARHIASVYPDLSQRIVVQPHRLDNALLSELRVGDDSRSDTRVFAALGSINLFKGGKILCEVVAQFEGEDELEVPPKFLVIGKMDRTLPVPKSLQVHGQYDLRDLTSLIREYRVTDFLVLSICPETFSFTTHEALATGLPVWTLPLGAQQEAASQAANGNVIRIDPRAPIADSVFRALKDSVKAPQDVVSESRKSP